MDYTFYNFYNYDTNDHSDYMFWSQSLRVFLWSKTVILSCSSVVCVVLNLLMILFFILHKKFRSLTFCPLMIQSLVDIIGPGIANVMFEVLLLDRALSSRTFRSVNQGMAYWMEFKMTRGISLMDCTLTFLRVSLNEYTTGTCVLATAYIRYALVCHASRKNLVEKKTLMTISFLIVIVALTAVGWNLANVKFEAKEGYMSFDYYTAEAQRRKLLEQCDHILTRRSTRLLIETITCFAVPAVLSGLFYAKVIIKLLKRERDAMRNRSLTIAFVISWLLWVFCWVPYFWGMTTSNESGVRVGYMMNIVSGDFSLKHGLQSAFSLSKYSIQMIYSHLNALIFIIVLKPFREWLKGLLKRPIVMVRRRIGITKVMQCVFLSTLLVSFYTVGITVSTIVYTSSWEYNSSIKGLDLAKAWEAIVLNGRQLNSIKMKTKLDLEPWGNFSKRIKEFAVSSSVAPDPNYGTYYFSFR